MFTRIDEAVSFARGIAKKIRENLGTATSLAENRAMTLMYNISAILDDIAEMFERARCLAADSATKIDNSIVARFCSTWQLVETNGMLLLTRTKPATTVAYDGREIRFRREDVTFRADANMVHVCRKKVCLDIDPTNKEQIIDVLPELTYVLRFIQNHVRKSRDALVVCARLNKPACLSI